MSSRGYVPSVNIGQIKQLGFNAFRDDFPWSDFELAGRRMGFTPRLARLDTQVQSGVARPLLILAFGHHLVPNSSPPTTDEARQRFADYARGSSSIGGEAASDFRALERVESGSEERTLRILARKLPCACPGDTTSGQAERCRMRPLSLVRSATIPAGPGRRRCCNRHPSIRRRRLNSSLQFLHGAGQTHVDGDYRPAHDVSSPRRPSQRQSGLPHLRDRDGLDHGNKQMRGQRAGSSRQHGTAHFVGIDRARWLKGMWIYELKNSGQNPSELEDNFGLYRFDNSAKPIACAARGAWAFIRSSLSAERRNLANGVVSVGASSTTGGKVAVLVRGPGSTLRGPAQRRSAKRNLCYAVRLSCKASIGGLDAGLEHTSPDHRQ